MNDWIEKLYPELDIPHIISEAGEHKKVVKDGKVEEAPREPLTERIDQQI